MKKFTTFMMLLAAFSGNAMQSKIYKDDSKKDLLFTMDRVEKSQKDTTSVERIHKNIDGSVAVVEKVEYHNDRLAKFALENKQNGESGTVEVKGDKVHFYFKKANGEVKTDVEDFSEDTLVGDQIVPFLKKHWAEILKGESLKVRYVALSRAETVGFKFFKTEETRVDGKDVIAVKMKPSSFIIAALVDPLYFYMEKAADHKLLALKGRVLPKVKTGDKWKDLDAYTIYNY